MEINYSKEINKKIDLINSIFDELSVPHLLENPDFSVYYMSSETWLSVSLEHKKDNRIPLWITITKNTIEIRLDRISEAITLSDNFLKTSPANARLKLINVFTSYILVEYYGSFRTQMRLFNPEGECTNIFNYYQGISFWGKRKSKLYSPIYSLIE
ncbi:hypothetical protein [Bacteroides sp. 519]|uniref:hypothetical protein n=1 Tax=Bacteroides sp. 519 TaxID=2302937 RepID=UPI0013D818F9|nr:hypothetical protein [Bacteroides sp. 519]NDV60154.1 hypothetical protein [Bacteroides sp. 519]